MAVKVLLPLLVCLSFSFAMAQQTKPASRPQVEWLNTPELHADNSVTFRFLAPNAKEVKLEREGAPPVAMQKDDQGVWSVTTPPLTPDYYGYSILVDGVRMLDPFNHRLVPNLLTPGSAVYIPGSSSWDAADVPDPQDEATFLRSKLDWEQRHHDPYLGLHAWYKELIALRRARPELTDPRLDRVQADFDEAARWLLVRRGRLRIAANLGGKAVRLPLGQRGTGVLAASSPGVAIKQDKVTMPPASFAVVETRALGPV